MLDAFQRVFGDLAQSRLQHALTIICMVFILIMIRQMDAAQKGPNFDHSSAQDLTQLSIGPHQAATCGPKIGTRDKTGMRKRTPSIISPSHQKYKIIVRRVSSESVQRSRHLHD